jgi:hypothetical protein
MRRKKKRFSTVVYEKTYMTVFFWGKNPAKMQKSWIWAIFCGADAL